MGIAQLDAAVKDLINAYHRCDLPKVWGTGASAAADGTKYDLAENSLLVEYSIRYGGYGGTFIRRAWCGTRRGTSSLSARSAARTVA